MFHRHKATADRVKKQGRKALPGLTPQEISEDQLPTDHMRQVLPGDVSSAGLGADSQVLQDATVKQSAGSVTKEQCITDLASMRPKSMSNLR